MTSAFFDSMPFTSILATGADAIGLYGRAYQLWLDEPYAPIVEAFRASGQSAPMCVYRSDNRWDASSVELENGIIRRYSKKFRARNALYRLGFGMLKANVVAAWPLGVP